MDCDARTPAAILPVNGQKALATAKSGLTGGAHKNQGNELFNRTCLFQLQMRLVFPAIESWTHKS